MTGGAPIAIAVFAKTPGLTAVKTRLAADIGRTAADDFYILGFDATYAVLHAAMQKNKNITVHIALAEKNGAAHPFWNRYDDFEKIWTGEGDLGARQYHIYKTLYGRYENARVILLGADSPQLTPQIIADTITALEKHDFVLGPAHDGGYYLFGGRVAMKEEQWQGIPWSSAKTAKALTAKLPAKPYMLPPLCDVDTGGDLAVVLDDIAALGDKAHAKQRAVYERMRKIIDGN